MKVKELKEKLNNYNDDSEIQVVYVGEYGCVDKHQIHNIGVFFNEENKVSLFI